MKVSHPRQINQYNITTELGRGGYATVCKAFNRENRRTYAIKIFPKSNLRTERERDRFQREVNAATFIRHESLVALHDFFWDDNNFYLVQDFCAGGDLFHQICSKGKLEEPLAALVFKQIVTAVQYMHSYGVAHRDIKPENILTDRWPRIKVADFGLVGYTDDDTKMSTFVGSTSYCSPECISKIEYDGCLSDVWSLGVLLYVIVTGVNPWTQGNTVKMTQEITTGDYTIPDDLSEMCSDLIRQMLCVDPANRATMATIAAHPWLDLADESRMKLPSKAPAPKGQPQLPPLKGFTLKHISDVSRLESQRSETKHGIFSPFETSDISSDDDNAKRAALPNFCIRSTSFHNLMTKNAHPVVTPMRQSANMTLSQIRQRSSGNLMKTKLPPISQSASMLSMITEE